MTPIILASESPRRRQLLADAGFSFDVLSVKVSEIPDKNLNVNAQILDIAQRKAIAVLPLLKSSRKEPFIVISADTEVIFNDAPLGKPENPEDAFRMLRLLSGTDHQVITAVCMIESGSTKVLSQTETTRVYFKQLTDQEIWTYIQSGEPMDKAGAYGIQGLAGQFVEKFEGPFDNVVGLPVDLVKKMLKEFGR
ncbi:Septum formation protein Maf [compost metagenome]